jgi:hypothetical protein
MRLLKRAAVVAAAPVMSLAILTGLGGAPASAQASQPSVPLADLHGCPAHSFCMWNNAGFTGTRWTYNDSTLPHNLWLPVGSAANNKASSLDNNRALTTGFSKNLPPSTGSFACLFPHRSLASLAAHTWLNGTPMNNSISGFALSSTLLVPGCIQRF